MRIRTVITIAVIATIVSNGSSEALQPMGKEYIRHKSQNNRSPTAMYSYKEMNNQTLENCEPVFGIESGPASRVTSQIDIRNTKIKAGIKSDVNIGVLIPGGTRAKAGHRVGSYVEMRNSRIVDCDQ